jgi:hypothetical protein
MSDMCDKRPSMIVFAALFLLVSVNKAYSDQRLSTMFRGALLASIAEEEFPRNDAIGAPPASAGPSITPSTFGAFGDARQIANGCNATAFSRSVTCPSGTFLSGDKGKNIWFAGAGKSGVAFGTIIYAVSSSTTITISAAPPTSVTQGRTVYGHDDTAALQSCFTYSGANEVPCVLGSPTGYLVGSVGLTIPTHMNVIGSSFTQGTNIFCEINGDCLSLQPGPVTGVNLSNVELNVDASQPLGRGIHLNAATGGGYSYGGLFNATFTSIQVDNMANECIWFDGGGGVGYAYNLPNQYINLFQFNCNGPAQAHPANMIKMTGQNAQIIFIDGAVNGVVNTPADQTQLELWLSYYPNPLIAIEPKTTGLNDSPVDVTFFAYTYEVGTQGLYISQASDIHYDNGYVEQVPSPLIVANTAAFTFNGNHVANAGYKTAVAQLGLNTTGSFRDNNIEVSPGYSIPDMAVCTGPATVDFTDNVSPTTTTTGCATIQDGMGSSTLTVAGTTEFLNGSSTAVTTISAPNVMPGKTLTLYAGGGPFTLAPGGGISFGGLIAPLTITTGGSVTLTKFDLGPTWLVTSATGIGPYSATGTPLPACASGIKGQSAAVSDALTPTYMSAYISGGAITAAVICSYDGVTYSWRVH